jgi:hypothetical protein
VSSQGVIHRISPQPSPVAIRAAMEQHVQRVRRLQSVYDELERIAELIADATCIHTREPEATRRLGLVTRVSNH